MDLSPILVIGSANMDMVVKSERLPRPGETVIGGTFSMAPGGKGANQAVAAARMGGLVTFLTCLGDDEFGRSLVGLYNAEGINTSLVETLDEAHTGVAFILVDSLGENMISVASGANTHFTPERLEALERLPVVPKWVVLQLEIPLDTVVTAARWAKSIKANVILDPAPAPQREVGLPDELLRLVDLITPNEVETEALVGEPITSEIEAATAGRRLIKRGVREVIVKMGERGGVYVSKADDWVYSTPRVRAVDSTAAGDCFTGALAVALAEGMGRREAVEWASRAAALSVTRMGAQSSLPTRDEVLRN